MTDQPDPYAPPSPGSTPARARQPPAYSSPEEPPPYWAPADYGRAELPVPHHLLASPWRRLGGALLAVVLFLVTLGIGYIIWAVLTWRHSTTPTKHMLGMRVVDSRTGNPLSFGGMVMRQVVWFGVIWTGSFFTGGIVGIVDACFTFSDTRRRLLDRMASTLVLHDS